MNLHNLPTLVEIVVRDGLYLRLLEADDSEQLLAILDRDPTIRERVTVAKRFHTSADVEKEIAAIAADDGLVRYSIVEDEKVVGLVSFWRDDGFFGQQPERDGYGFGYFLDPLARGRGIVGASLRALMAETRQHLEVRVFMAFCEDDNLASIAVLTRLGFERTNETYGEPNTGWLERKYRLQLN